MEESVLRIFLTNIGMNCLIDVMCVMKNTTPNIVQNAQKVLICFGIIDKVAN